MSTPAQRTHTRLTALRRSLARIIVDHRSAVQEDHNPAGSFADADELLWQKSRKLWADAGGRAVTAAAEKLLQASTSLAPRPGIERDLRRGELQRLLDQVLTLHDAILRHEAQIVGMAQQNMAAQLSSGRGPEELTVGEVPFAELDEQLWLTGEGTHTEATRAPTERTLLERHVA